MNSYTEYYTHRKQAGFAQPVIAFWHKRMLHIAQRYIPYLATKTILEIGGIRMRFAEREPFQFGPHG